MNYNKKQEIILETLKTTFADQEWVNLAQLAIELKKQKVGFVRLKDLLENHQKVVELRTDYAVYPPVVYTKLK